MAILELGVPFPERCQLGLEGVPLVLDGAELVADGGILGHLEIELLRELLVPLPYDSQLLLEGVQRITASVGFRFDRFHRIGDELPHIIGQILWYRFLDGGIDLHGVERILVRPLSGGESFEIRGIVYGLEGNLGLPVGVQKGVACIDVVAEADDDIYVIIDVPAVDLRHGSEDHDLIQFPVPDSRNEACIPHEPRIFLVVLIKVVA